MKYHYLKGVNRDYKEWIGFALAAIGLIALIFFIVELTFTGTFTQPIIKGL
jgi:hypothetical protein